MTFDGANLKQYWRTISELTDRLVANTTLMRDWATEIPASDDFDVLTAIIDNSSLKFARILARDKRVRPPGDPGLANQRVPQLVSEADNNFVEGLRLLIEEISERMVDLPPSNLRRSIEAFLSENVHTLMARFDTFTEAWDHLVILKSETSIPNRRSRKLDAWFMAVMGLAERFVRDVIGVTILLVDKELVAKPLLACFASQELNVPHPTAEQLLHLPSTEAAITDAVMTFMDRGSRYTVIYAKEFAQALGAPLFPLDDVGFRPGILDALTFLQGSTEDALVRLFYLRHSIVHETTRELRSESEGLIHELLYELDLSSLKLVPDFVCAFCFGFAIRMLVTVGQQVDDSHRGLVSGLRFQLSGVLRVLLKELLTAERYELAWAMAQTALEVEPKGPAMMVRMNSYYARLQFDQERMDLEEIRTLDVGNLPRYKLLKRSILGELQQEDVEPILDEALSVGDMSLSELLTWPALRPLRECRWWDSWVRKHPRE